LSDDYPDYAKAVAEAVSLNPNEHRGILICGSGAGVCIAANKIKGIRAALAANPKMAKAMRNDDDSNILCLASDFTAETEAIKIAEAFLNTPFGAEERYIRRIKKIEELEQ
jgi:ribose 5-phosphate isomerase B